MVTAAVAVAVAVAVFVSFFSSLNRPTTVAGTSLFVYTLNPIVTLLMSSYGTVTFPPSTVTVMTVSVVPVSPEVPSSSPAEGEGGPVASFKAASAPEVSAAGFLAGALTTTCFVSVVTIVVVVVTVPSSDVSSVVTVLVLSSDSFFFSNSAMSFSTSVSRSVPRKMACSSFLKSVRHQRLKGAVLSGHIAERWYELDAMDWLLERSVMSLESLRNFDSLTVASFYKGGVMLVSRNRPT